MGISVQASGIKIEKNKYYLVNLNADPSLNEMLVYYLKVRYILEWSHGLKSQKSHEILKNCLQQGFAWQGPAIQNTSNPGIQDVLGWNLMLSMV